MQAREFQPHGYQTLIIDYIIRQKRCAIWCFMGAGKTVSTLSALAALDFVEPVFPVLVVAPLRVAVSTWPSEMAKWAHLRHLRGVAICGTAKQRADAVNRPADVYTINFENLPWLIEHLGPRWRFRVVVIDEATKLKGLRISEQTSKTGKTFLKSNGGTQRALALALIAHTQIDRLIELTGTPAPNGLADLWGQMWLLDKGQRLGKSYTAFSDRWFKPERNGWGTVPLPYAQEQIQTALGDVCLTIDAKDWFDLDDAIVVPRYVDLPPAARVQYDEMERRMFLELAEGRTAEAPNAAAKTIKCLQMANGAVYLDPLAEDDKASSEWEAIHDVKLQALDEIVTEAAGMPVLVAYHFKSDLARLKKAFPKGRHLDSNPHTVDDWNAGRIPVLFAHPASAGHGLNLQDGGNILVYFGHWWNLEERQQIAERVGPVRQMQAGHNRPAFIYNIVARDTVDELVLERVASKKSVQDILLNSMRSRANSRDGMLSLPNTCANINKMPTMLKSYVNSCESKRKRNEQPTRSKQRRREYAQARAQGRC